MRSGNTGEKTRAAGSHAAGQDGGNADRDAAPSATAAFQRRAEPDPPRTILLLNGPQQVVAYDLLESKILRAIESKHQLAEELDDFWFNHFNVYLRKGRRPVSDPEYEREVIRPNVLGQVPRLAGGHGQESGDAFLSWIISSRCGPTWTPTTKTEK